MLHVSYVKEEGVVCLKPVILDDQRCIQELTLCCLCLCFAAAMGQIRTDRSGVSMCDIYTTSQTVIVLAFIINNNLIKSNKEII